ncbi:hypothetical protein P6F26_16705 [Roseibacterium sp. SDUM158017]|uniref:hypothetical protein n=1 Tax=Roseicyclus salinarum TaxID=3036773 RepID=UPI002415359D|nr:hypothetical protein [Roseibacterium sp. SDUM158017]MDG4650090.1 hypothetical protein [Roseibacterium sp. SDUM158017]
MMDGNPAPRDHNNPPDSIDEALVPYGDFITEAEGWLDGEPVTTEGQMQVVDELLKQIKAAEKAVKAAEESEAKPLYDAWKACKARFAPTLDDLGRLKKGLVALVDGFKRQLAAERAKEEAAKRAAAEKARREAEERARQADASDIEAQRKAAEAKAAADAAQEEARAAARDQVKGLRTVTKYEIDDHKAALHDIARNDREAITAFIEDYVRRRHKDRDIDGVRVWQEKVAF